MLKKRLENKFLKEGQKPVCEGEECNNEADKVRVVGPYDQKEER